VRTSTRLHGSLAFTSKRHATDQAVALGLLGHLPANLDPDRAERALAELHRTRVLNPIGLPALAFDSAADIVFDFGPPLGGHANALVFEARADAGAVLVSETYYSIGGLAYEGELDAASRPAIVAVPSRADEFAPVC
jgi:L-serine dehydratase